MELFFVFRAAALKEVPSCEFFPMEAVQTNVIGTDNVITAAVENKVEEGGFSVHGQSGLSH